MNSEFEYNTVTLHLLDRELRTTPPSEREIENSMESEDLKRLNALGASGWDVVSVVPVTLAKAGDLSTYRAFLRRARH